MTWEIPARLRRQKIPISLTRYAAWARVVPLLAYYSTCDARPLCGIKWHITDMYLIRFLYVHAYYYLAKMTFIRANFRKSLTLDLMFK